jgi:hypothetical protein
MTKLSSSQALWPAAIRTWKFLFRPFDFDAYLRICAVAALTECILVSFHFVVWNALPFDPSPLSIAEIQRLLPALVAPEFITFTILAITTMLLLFLFAFYLLIHLRFVLFHCLLHGTTDLRPAWDLYRTAAARLFRANLLVLFGLLALFALVIGGIAVVVFSVLTLRTPDGKLDPGVFLILFLPLVGFIALTILAGLIAEFVIHDFILPHMALEGATFRQAWQSARRIIVADKDAFFSWFILRLGVPLVAVTLLVILALLPGFLLFGALENSAAGFNAMLEDSTGFLAVVRFLLNAGFICLGLGVGSAIAASLGGPVGVFIRYQALCFYASRYPKLAEILNADDPE